MIPYSLQEGWSALVLEPGDELPSMDGVQTLYADFETSGLYPYSAKAQHYACGIAVLRDEEQTAYYVPYRHVSSMWNCNPDAVREWLKSLCSVPEWVNHNWKFDGHFLLKEGVRYPGRAIDTWALAHIIDSDRPNHELKSLMRAWCRLDTDEEDEVKAWLKRRFKKQDDWNFAEVPADLLGRYACTDVLGNREVYRYLQVHLEDEMRAVWDMEIELTQVLFDVEQQGIRVVPAQVAQEHLDSIEKRIEAETTIYRITGREFVDSPQVLSDILRTQLRLPIIEYNYKRGEGGKFIKTGPSFKKAVLEQYLSYPEVSEDPEKKACIEAIQVAREEQTYQALFLDPCLEHLDEENLIHPSYKQIIRTGRMSTSKPCIHQFNVRAKALIHSLYGREFAAWDASQLEFRIIVHYIADPIAIAAYREDPRTDFHDWVAELCAVDRKAAKNINFAMAFNAGKKKVMRMLASNSAVIDEVIAEAKQMVYSGEMHRDSLQDQFSHLCMQKAAEIYHRYHERLPGIKVLTRESANLCKLRGYIRTAFGRRRHIHPDFAYKAFNSAVQGTAMDYIKTRLIACAKDPYLQEKDIRLCINTHDQIVFDGPAGVFDSALTREHITRVLETQPIPFAVPFLWTFEGISSDGLPRKGFARFPEMSSAETQENPVSETTLTGT